MPDPTMLPHGNFELAVLSSLTVCLTEKGELPHLVNKYCHAAVKFIINSLFETGL